MSSGTRRLVLWRDVSALLFGVVGVVLVAQFALQSGRFSEVASATDLLVPEATDFAAGAAPPPGSSAQVTSGPVIAPGLIAGIEATPTPIPIVISSPSATRRPAATPRPTPRATPTPPPTAAPTPSPSPTSAPATSSPTPPPPPPPLPPPPTPVPPPVILSVSCDPATGTAPIVSLCSATGTDVDSWSWDFGDGTTGAGAVVSHTFLLTGSMTVVVTATGPGGDTVTDQTTVEVLP